MSELRNAEQLADISYAEWCNASATDKAAVLIEHFASGAQYEPVFCGFCRDLVDVLRALKATEA